MDWANGWGQGYRVARDADDRVVRTTSLPAIEHAGAVVTAFLGERGRALHSGHNP